PLKAVTAVRIRSGVPKQAPSIGRGLFACDKHRACRIRPPTSGREAAGDGRGLRARGPVAALESVGAEVLGPASGVGWICSAMNASCVGARVRTGARVRRSAGPVECRSMLARYGDNPLR